MSAVNLFFYFFGAFIQNKKSIANKEEKKKHAASCRDEKLFTGLRAPAPSLHELSGSGLCCCEPRTLAKHTRRVSVLC